MVLPMVRKRKPSVTRSVRFFEEVAEVLDQYADDIMISSNAAVNKLIKERLEQLGYTVDTKTPPE